MLDPLPRLVVLSLMMRRSVRRLGRRTLGATTPQASLSRRLMESVHFLEEGVGGGRLPSLGAISRRWWSGAISSGRPGNQD